MLEPTIYELSRGNQHRFSHSRVVYSASLETMHWLISQNEPRRNTVPFVHRYFVFVFCSVIGTSSGPGRRGAERPMELDSDRGEVHCARH